MLKNLVGVQLVNKLPQKCTHYLFLLLAFLSACTPTPVVPISTQPALTLPTPAPTSTSTALPTPLANLTERIAVALRNTQTLTSYNLEYGVQASGVAPRWNRLRGKQVDYRATFDDAQVAFSYRGATSGMTLTQGLEVLRLPGRVFVRGPLAVPSAGGHGWYDLSAAPPPITQPPFTAAQLVQQVVGSVPLTAFREFGTLRLDDQICERSRADAATALAMLASAGFDLRPDSVSNQAASAQLEAAGYIFDDATAAQLVICPDQFLRQVQLTLSMAQRDAPNDSFTLNLQLSIDTPATPSALRPPTNVLLLNADEAIKAIPKP
jgi:hypothetical protein